MAQSILDIIIKFSKQGGADKDTIKSLVDVKMGITQAMGVMAALAGVGVTLNAVYQNTVKVFQDYAAQVRETSRLTGASAEATSRMIQMADDMAISYDTLQKSLWFASKQGIEISIDSLGRLADQYNALKTPAEKAGFLAKTFGKNGEEMGKMMEKGSAGVDRMSASIENGLILNTKALQEAEDLRVAQDDLADGWKAVEVAAGELLAHPIAENLSIWADLMRAFNRELDTGGIFNWFAVFKNLAELRVGRHVEELAGIPAMLGDGARDAATRVQALNSSMDDGASDAERFKNSMSDLKAEISGELGKAETDHIQRMKDLNDQLEKAKKPSEKSGIQEQINAETEAYARRAKEIQYNIISEVLLRDTNISDSKKLTALNDLSASLGLQDQQTHDLLTQTNAYVTALENGSITEQEFATGLKMLHGQAIPTKNSVEDLAGEAHTMADNFHLSSDRVKAVIDQLKALDGMHVFASITVTQYGSAVIAGLNSNPVTNNNYHQHPGPVAMFGGGFPPAGQWILTGDKPGGAPTAYSELISPWGEIIPANVTQMLLAYGLVHPDSAFLGSSPLAQSDSTYHSGGGSSSRRARRRNNSAGAAVTLSGSDLVSDNGAVGVDVGALVASMDSQTGTATQALQVVAQASNVQSEQARRQTEAVQNGNQQIIDAINDLRTDFPKAVKDAVKLLVGG